MISQTSIFLSMMFLDCAYHSFSSVEIWLYPLLACVSEGCYNEDEDIFILILNPFFMFLLLGRCLVHFQANVALKEKSHYQKPFYIKTKEIKDLGFSI
jgi:hypothetical protein